MNPLDSVQPQLISTSHQKIPCDEPVQRTQAASCTVGVSPTTEKRELELPLLCSGEELRRNKNSTILR